MSADKGLAIPIIRQISNEHQRIPVTNIASRTQIVGGLFIFSFEAALFTCLVLFGQRGPDADSCASRAKDAGFIGNPDFYGLADLYDVFVPGIIFSLAQAIALVVLICQHGCVYTAEIIILATLLWTGIYVLDVPGWTSTGIAFKRASTAVAGLTWALTLPTLLWFLTRTAIYGERDFNATPGGTVGFLFCRVSTRNLDAASAVVLALLCFRLMAGVLSLLLVLCRAVRLSAGEKAVEGLLSLWRRLLWVVHLPICKAHLIIAQGFKTGKRSTGASRLSEMNEQAASLGGRSTLNCKCRHFQYAITRVIAFVLTVIGVECSLVWNGIEGINSINSTGQIVPFITGCVSFLGVWWKMSPQRQSLVALNKARQLGCSRPHPTSFQQEDSAWV